MAAPARSPSFSAGAKADIFYAAPFLKTSDEKKNVAASRIEL